MERVFISLFKLKTNLKKTCTIYGVFKVEKEKTNNTLVSKIAYL